MSFYTQNFSVQLASALIFAEKSFLLERINRIHVTLSILYWTDYNPTAGSTTLKSTHIAYKSQ